MKTSFFGIFSATLCLLSTFVAASPVAIDARDVVVLDTRDTVALDARDTVALDARDVLVTIDVTINIAIESVNECNSRYRSQCSRGGCGQHEILAWSLEINVILSDCTASINNFRHNGGSYTDSEFTHYTSLFGNLLIQINIGIWWLGNNCDLGLVGGLLGLVLNILGAVVDLLGVDGLLYDTTVCLWELVDCLGVDYWSIVHVLQWGTSCCLCGIPSIA